MGLNPTHDYSMDISAIRVYLVRMSTDKSKSHKERVNISITQESLE